jgi:hypothetical protein
MTSPAGSVARTLPAPPDHFDRATMSETPSGAVTMAAGFGNVVDRTVTRTESATLRVVCESFRCVLLAVGSKELEENGSRVLVCAQRSEGVGEIFGEC